MRIITFDPNINTLSYKLYNLADLKLLAQGIFERIGLENSSYSLFNEEFDFSQEVVVNNFEEAIDLLFNKLISSGLIINQEEVSACSVRAFHGGELYKESVIVTDKVVSDINELASFDPHGNPNAVTVINYLRELDPNRPIVAVFDTAFYQSLKKEDYLYPLPYRWYNEYKVRKYGFYGTSHRHVYKQVKKHYKKDINIISCHLGNGGNITAIKQGEAIDTSMGFSPLSGIMMGSRSGDIDPAIITYIMERDGKSAGEVLADLSNKSGFLGVTEMTSEVKDVFEALSSGNEKAKLALDMFISHVVSYIAEYYIKLEKVDALCFTAGIGENAIEIRKKIVNKLKALDIMLDEDANQVQAEFSKISDKKSSIDVFVVPNDEHMMMAIDTKKNIR